MRQEAQNPNLVWDKYKSPLISVICGSEKFLRVPLRLLRCYTSPQQAPYQRCNLMDGLGTQSEEGYLQNRSSHILSTPRFLRLSADSVDKPSASEAYVYLCECAAFCIPERKALLIVLSLFHGRTDYSPSITVLPDQFLDVAQFPIKEMRVAYLKCSAMHMKHFMSLL
ncbi:hypothetical protein M513_11171 [Trichuris suis]|uniref:Uncharacterized protein n=1 Tax=Trichuris suis TaxID=68888 RepID=A0A085LSJ2_9BILA|nr:hypothetical protein M513_11171 [Trichuris suis]